MADEVCLIGTAFGYLGYCLWACCIHIHADLIWLWWQGSFCKAAHSYNDPIDAACTCIRVEALHVVSEDNQSVPAMTLTLPYMKGLDLGSHAGRKENNQKKKARHSFTTGGNEHKHTEPGGGQPCAHCNGSPFSGFLVAWF